MKRNKLYILPLILSLFWGLTSCEDDSSIESAGTEASASGITLKLSCCVANFAVLQRKINFNIAQRRVFGVPQIAVFG